MYWYTWIQEGKKIHLLQQKEVYQRAVGNIRSPRRQWLEHPTLANSKGTCQEQQSQGRVHPALHSSPTAAPLGFLPFTCSFCFSSSINGHPKLLHLKLTQDRMTQFSQSWTQNANPQDAWAPLWSGSSPLKRSRVHGNRAPVLRPLGWEGGLVPGNGRASLQTRPWVLAAT